MRLRDVVEVKVSPTDGQKVIPIKAYVVPEISSIQNSHVELAKGEYPHLKELWFSDVCMGAGELGRSRKIERKIVQSGGASTNQSLWKLN